MTDSHKLQDDLAYVRAAVDRQRRLTCEYLPVWLAITIGGLLVALTLVRDLVTLGHIGENVLDWAIIVFAVAGIGGVVTHAMRKRAGSSERTGGASQLKAREKRLASLQALVFVSGLLVLNYALDQGGIGGRTEDIITFTYVGVCMTLMGLSGLHILLWFGVGTAVGTLAFAFLDIDFAKTMFGVCLATGLVFGSWLDRRALARQEG